ncbi:MAG: hypothetical protein KBD28_03565 [Chitinophagaceae bacterium]|nr:hypothetical protein [Chitinophagaceae bacterium]
MAQRISKDLLEGLSKEDFNLGNVPNLDTTDAVNKAHSHTNSSILDTITNILISNWNTAYNWVNTNGVSILSTLTLKENSSNKQNNLTASPTNFPTVDAVNTGLALKKDKLSTISTVTTTSTFPNSDIIIFGNGATALTGTINTTLMSIKQTITIKRAVGATGTLTIKGVTGNINTKTNTMVATTTLATAGSYGQVASFIWDGTNLIRIN